MSQAMINFRIDEDLKKSMETVCREMGMSMTTAFTIFATTVSRERRIPFEISADPFFSESNMKYLEKKMDLYKKEQLNFAKHELIEN